MFFFGTLALVLMRGNVCVCVRVVFAKAQATARYKAEQEAANDAAAALSEKLAAAQQQLNQRLQSTAELEQELKSARAALQTVENVAEQSQLDLESKVLVRSFVFVASTRGCHAPLLDFSASSMPGHR